MKGRGFPSIGVYSSMDFVMGWSWSDLKPKRCNTRIDIAKLTSHDDDFEVARNLNFLICARDAD